MGLYGFKQRFVPMIQDGSKRHTIRAERKKGHAKPGEKMFLYCGLRTKHTFKIGEAQCDYSEAILIHEEFILFKRKTEAGQIVYIELKGKEADKLAWRDGFRPEGSTCKEPGEAFALMIRYWKMERKQTGNDPLPFVGVIIYWKNFVPAEKKPIPAR